MKHLDVTLKLRLAIDKWKIALKLAFAVRA